MYFIGIDLAWSEKNDSCISTFQEDEFIEYKFLKTNEEIVRYINSFDNGKIVAIDAPLIVKNKTGLRRCEKDLVKFFRRYKIGVHATNLNRLKTYGGERCLQLAKMFEKYGYANTPNITRNDKINAIIEVYPHPAIVSIFNLKERLKYKSKFDREIRLKNLDLYSKLILSLANRDPCIKVPKDILNKNLENLKTSELKRYEDLLDSIICAYIAKLFWYYPEKCIVFGDDSTGYIITPSPEAGKSILSFL